jgi:hypothetical protein
VLEVGAAIGIAAVGALWRMAYEQGSMKRGMDAILREVQMLRGELSKDIRVLEERLEDHEIRLRQMERR